jgi:hypothetical protein
MIFGLDFHLPLLFPVNWFGPHLSGLVVGFCSVNIALLRKEMKSCRRTKSLCSSMRKARGILR